MDASFKSKADKLLGLDAQGGDSGKIQVQQCGYLSLKGVSRVKQWKRFYCVIKDGFFLWYASAPSTDDDQPFNTKPKGAIPLNGSVLSIDLKDKRVFSFEHPDIPNASFKLRAEDQGDAMGWYGSMEGAKKCSWENALLGNALVEKMKQKGTQLEAEKEEAFREMQEKAAKLDKERLQKEQALLKAEARQKQFRERLDAEKEKTNKLESERSTIENKLSSEEKARREAERKRMSVERKLGEAEKALQLLEEAMVVRTSASPNPRFEREDNEVRASVSALRRFFEARANEQAIRRKALYERMI